MAARPRLRILCFGDSLTNGYSCMGAIHHPYCEKMEHMLTMAFPDLKIETEEDGMSGATVKHGFQTRMNAHFTSKKKRKAAEVDDDVEDKSKPYDWAIVLGGTNDLGMGISPEDIFEALKAVWEVPLSRKCKVLALTVPEAGLKGAIRERIDAKRNALNDLIRGYKHENFYVYDLHAHIPYHSLPPADIARYWDDHLHLTPEGYDLVGNKVGIALVSLLARERANHPARPQKRRRIFRGDDKTFTEEAGDPTAIDQGYVVVRKVDLE
ncbi:SGNH hydrolase-type esterase domain-containing protein [Staphylotrichum tortipilum]|uniref:SGNH hydrolase-type esterase domain-containing protein n=1 Tax=Staphylotrichum tortipilum TaxID=2831512 RepID=A0AAN6MMB5_9PEZI|nr:SGNH hydrolase-type esterase domain-containing protein [Staphylotrichum longicolle]